LDIGHGGSGVNGPVELARGQVVDRILARHKNADKSYMDEGVQLLADVIQLRG